MQLTGTFNWSVVDDSVTLRNADGEAVFSLSKLASGLHKSNITGMKGRYNYLSDVIYDNDNNLVFTLFKDETEVLRIMKKSTFMQGVKFETESILGDYKVNVNAAKTKAEIIKGKETVLSCVFERQDYDLTISDNENPVFLCSAFYGIVLLLNLD